MTAFFDTSTKMGLCQDADFLVGSNTDKYPLVDKARNATEWLKKAGQWIWQSSDDWEFDDSNYTTLPWATTDVTDGQQDISLPTTVFKIDRLEIMDSNGKYQLVRPIDKSQIKDSSLEQHYATAGLPVEYDLVGNSILLYPPVSASNVTLAEGLKLFLARDVSPFASTDTSKEPGFSEYFHRIVSVGMALDYAIAKGLSTRIVTLKRMIYGDPNVPDDIGLKGELQRAYGSRHRDMKPSLNVIERERMI